MEDYEIKRQKRLEENRRRMQELGLSKLSQDFVVAARKRQVPTKRKIQVLEFPVERRTSGREKHRPKTFSEEVKYEINNHRPKKKTRSDAKASSELEYSASPKAREMAQQHAENVVAELNLQHPYLIKSLVRSQVSGGFWLGLPKHFCEIHLPNEDSMIVLEDAEKNIKDKAKFLADRTALSGGWKGFSCKHRLDDGDAVIFHLVAPKKFKLYIIKAKGFEPNGEHNKKREQKINSKKQISPNQKLQQKHKKSLSCNLPKEDACLVEKK